VSAFEWINSGEDRPGRSGVAPLDLLHADLAIPPPAEDPEGSAPAATLLGAVTTRRFAATLWALQALMLAAFAPLASPTEAVGSAGWAILAAMVAVSLAAAGAIWLRPERVTDAALYVGSFGAITILGVSVWLTGEATAPSSSVALLWLISVPLTSTVRQAVVFGAFVAVVAFAPMAYSGWDSATAVDIGSRLLIAVALASLGAARLKSEQLLHAALQRSSEEAGRLAYVDPLTALPNRRCFDRDMALEVEVAESAGKPLTLVFADINGFKEINDLQGHTAGDRHLQGVATRLREVLRDGDAAYRWGGDEFALLLPGADRQGARRVCDRLEMLMLDERSPRFGPGVSLSFGLAEHHAGHPAEELIEVADLQLIAAKRGALA